MIKQLAFIVEGFTEYNFVKNVLAEYLKERYGETNINMRVTRMDGGIKKKRLEDEIRNWTHSHYYVTTLFDLYGFNKGIIAEPQKTGPGHGVADIEKYILGIDTGHADRIIPYIQQYEFEALLFSDDDKIISTLHANSEQAKRIKRIARKSKPEDINDNHPPSKRIEEVFPNYDKALYGWTIAREIGMDTIRQSCPRFDSWVKRLESL